MTCLEHMRESMRTLFLRSTASWPGRLWAYRWLLLADLYLMSPMLLHELRLAGERQALDKLLLFTGTASLLWLFVMHALVRRQAVLHAFLLPFYLTTATDLYLIRTYDMRLTSSALSVILENLGSAPAYIEAHTPGIFLALGAVVAFWGLVLFKLQGVRTEVSRRVAFSLVGAQVALYGAVLAKQVRAADDVKLGTLDVLSHDRSVPLGVLPQGYITYLAQAADEADRRKAASFRFGARRSRVLDGREVYVLVLGESSRPDRWHLYGYHRDTTPKLSAEPNLVAFRDVTTQAALTQISVPLILTRNAVDNWEAGSTEKSLVGAAREAGFTTLWLSTQQRDQWTGAINRYVGEAEIQRYYERRHDGVLVQELERLLDDPRMTGEKVFAVLHTQGSHYTFTERFPKRFAVYSHDKPGLSEVERVNNAYDDTIVYTDHVLAQVRDVIAKRAQTSAFFYVADHGENLYDDDRNLFGHFFGNQYDLPIPMLLWYSDNYVARFPEHVAAARANAKKRLSTNSVFHSVLDMIHVTMSDPRFETDSVLRPTFRERPRRAMSNWKVYTYDRELSGRVRHASGCERGQKCSSSAL